MNWELLPYLAIFGALTCGALILTGYKLWPYAEARLQNMIDEALSRPVNKPWQTLDDELIELVTNNKEND